MNKFPVLLFDGECAFCNACVVWLVKHERQPRYYFSPLQSDTARKLLQNFSAATDEFNSMVVIDEGKLYYKSTAALHLLRETRLPWRLLQIFKIIPRVIRDAVYDYIGKHRYRWFGKTETCVVADPGWHARLLDSSTIP